MTTPNLDNEQILDDSTPKDAPLAKAELETKKLELEIKELERPFWERPAYILAALPTLLAAVTLTIGFINGYFSAQLTKLENQKHDIETQIKDFERTRSQLYSENERLQTELNKKQKTIKDIQRIASDLRGIVFEQTLDEFTATSTENTKRTANVKVPMGIPKEEVERMTNKAKLNEMIIELNTMIANSDK
jgi:hypothetical protein